MKIRFVAIGLVLAALIVLTLGLSGVFDTPFRQFKTTKVYLYNFRNKNLSQDINLLYPHQQVVILKDLIYEDLLLLSNKGR